MNQIDELESQLKKLRDKFYNLADKAETQSDDVYYTGKLIAYSSALFLMHETCKDLLNKPLVDARVNDDIEMCCLNCHCSHVVTQNPFKRRCMALVQDNTNIRAPERLKDCPIQWSETTEKASEMLNAQYGNEEYKKQEKRP